MTVKTGNSFKTALNKITKKNGHKPVSDRTRISKAVAMLNLEPDKAVEVTNELMSVKDRYAKAAELLGQLRADKIRHSLQSLE